MVRELAMPKTSPRDVAFAILDGVEAGQEDIFPDPFAVDFGRRFQASPKASERQIAAMVASSAASRHGRHDERTQTRNRRRAMTKHMTGTRDRVAGRRGSSCSKTRRS